MIPDRSALQSPNLQTLLQNVKEISFHCMCYSIKNTASLVYHIIKGQTESLSISVLSYSPVLHVPHPLS